MLYLIFGLLVSWVIWLVALMKGGLRERVKDVIIVRMPQCPLCAEEGRPTAIRANSEELQMTFVVDKKFKERIKPRGES